MKALIGMLALILAAVAFTFARDRVFHSQGAAPTETATSAEDDVLTAVNSRSIFDERQLVRDRETSPDERISKVRVQLSALAPSPTEIYSIQYLHAGTPRASEEQDALGVFLLNEPLAPGDFLLAHASTSRGRAYPLGKARRDVDANDTLVVQIGAPQAARYRLLDGQSLQPVTGSARYYEDADRDYPIALAFAFSGESQDKGANLKPSSEGIVELTASQSSRPGWVTAVGYGPTKILQPQNLSEPEIVLLDLLASIEVLLPPAPPGSEHRLRVLEREQYADLPSHADRATLSEKIPVAPGDQTIVVRQRTGGEEGTVRELLFSFCSIEPAESKLFDLTTPRTYSRLSGTIWKDPADQVESGTVLVTQRTTAGGLGATRTFTAPIVEEQPEAYSWQVKSLVPPGNYLVSAPKFGLSEAIEVFDGEDLALQWTLLAAKRVTVTAIDSTTQLPVEGLSFSVQANQASPPQGSQADKFYLTENLDERARLRTNSAELVCNAPGYRTLSERIEYDGLSEPTMVYMEPLARIAIALPDQAIGAMQDPQRPRLYIRWKPAGETLWRRTAVQYSVPSDGTGPFLMAALPASGDVILLAPSIEGCEDPESRSLRLISGTLTYVERIYREP
jgi:hypothetical protein